MTNNRKIDINKTLAHYLRCKSSFRDELPVDNLVRFLEAACVEGKKNKAQTLVRQLVEKHHKEGLVNHIHELLEVESANMDLTNIRDHTIHAVNTFILGLYINDYYLGREVDLFQWKLASLFHDIAYPLEITKKIIGRYFDKMEEILKGSIPIDPKPTIKLDPKHITNLPSNISALNLIQEILNGWGIEVNAQEKYNEMVNANRICHGIISSLTVLYQLDSVYQYHNPQRVRERSLVKEGGYVSDCNQDNFELHIVPACSAIYIHNLEPTDFFAGCKEKSKLAYLLKLCDELQDWERPSASGREENYSHNYDISVRDQTLYFYVCGEDKRKKMSNKISCLADSNLTIEVYPNQER